VKYLSLIWDGIWRKRGRAILTGLQVLVAFVLFGLLQGMKSGIDDAIDKIGADLYIVQHATGFSPMPLAMYSRLVAVPGVRAAAYESFLAGTYQKPTQHVLAVACDQDSIIATIPHGAIVPQAAVDAMKRTRSGVLVSESLARKYGWKTGDRIPLETSVLRQDGSLTWTFDMLGTFVPGEQSLSPDFMIINYAYFDEARTIDRGTVAMYYVRVTDPKQGLAVAQAIDKLFLNSSDETRTESARESIQATLESLGDMDFVVRAIVGAVLFALLFSITAMMMQSIRERTAELALLKTLGFSDGKLFWIVLCEVLTLCIVAAALGLALATWVLPAARHFTNINVTMPASVVLAGLGLAALLAIVTATVPAMRARRLQVVDALAGR
jgi:putative ABC transport system permease protein